MAARVAAQIAGAVANSQLYPTVQNECRDREVLAQIGRITISSLDVGEVYERFAAQVRSLIPFDRMVVNLVDHQQGVYEVAYGVGIETRDREPGVRLPLGSLTGLVALRQTGFVLDSEDIERQGGELHRINAPVFDSGVKTSLGVPLVSGDAVIGVMILDSTRLRDLSTRLRPGVLDSFGLIAAIEWQAQEFQQRTGITSKVSLHVDDIDLDQRRSTTIFRIFQEAMTNVARHAQATKVSVRLNRTSGGLTLEIEDNGKGITRSEISNINSLGILGMRERARLMGGNVEFTGTDNKGTAVIMRIPLGTSVGG